MKQTISTMKKNGMTLMLTAIAILLCCFSAKAEYDGPAITSYYPAASEDALPAGYLESNAELRQNTSFFVYFQTGTKIRQMKGRVFQNDEFVGYVESKVNTFLTNTASFDKNVTVNSETLKKVTSGTFRIEYYYVNWDDNGTERVYSDEENPFGYVNYTRKGVVNVVYDSGLPGNTLYSWYPEDSEEGILVFKFDSPINASHANASLAYGSGLVSYGGSVDFAMSDDNKTMTLDFRGKLRNVATLAPGVTFTDDNGNPTTPPQVISLEITGLEGADGSTLVTTLISPNGSEITLTGQIFKNFKYKDISLPNPKLTKVEFFDAQNPDVLSASINETTDMLLLSIDNSEVIVTADMSLSVGAESVVIPDAEITKGDGSFTAALPDAIRSAGSDNLVINLVNVTYTENDGVDHIIAPLDLAHGTREVATVEAFKALAVGTPVILRPSGDLVCTLASDLGYTFMEDATGGIQLLDASGALEPQLISNARLNGMLQGVVYEGGVFSVDFEASSFSLLPFEPTVSNIVTDFDQLNDDMENMLVTVAATPTISITYEDGMFTLSGGDILVMGLTDIAEEEITLDNYAEVKNVTGVYYNIGGNDHILLVRNNGDINKELDIEIPDVPVPTEVKTIAELKKLEPGTEITIRPEGLRVNYTTESGISFVEDESGAMLFGADYGNFSETGRLITEGTITGTVYTENIFIVSEFNFDSIDYDVTRGTEMTPEEALLPENALRLITFTNDAEGNLITNDNGLVWIGESINVVDYFDSLDIYYEYPENIGSVTGMIIPQGLFGIDDDFGFGDSNVTLMTIRTAADITEKSIEPVLPTEVTTIAELKNLDNNTEVKFIANNVAVTFYNDEAAIVEDATGGLLVTGYEGTFFEAGKLLNGPISGYFETPYILYVTNWAEVTAGDTDVSKGAEMTPEEALLPENALRLATFKNNEDYSFITNVDNNVLIGGELEVFDVFEMCGEDYQYPEYIAEVTGIIINDVLEDAEPYAEGEVKTVICIRSEADVVKAEGVGIGINGADECIDSDIFNLQGMKVRNAGESLNGLTPGIYIINGKKIAVK